jgi:putative aldouronate transport system substrate-binding protein
MKKLRFLTGVMAALMVLSVFSGCSSKSSSKTKAIPANMNATGLPIMKSSTPFKIAVFRESLSTINYPDKQCVKEAEQKTNLKISWDEIPSSGWTEKINIMFASGDLPDAIAGKTDVVKNQGSLVALTPYINQYGPNIKKMFNNVAGLKKQLTCTDGQIYSLPAADCAPMNMIPDTLFVNKDWLTKLNLQVPKTTDEFYNVLKAMKTKDPNGNGKQDEIPLAVTNSNAYYASTLCSLFGSFGTLYNTDNYIRVENNKCIFEPSEKGFYEALQYFNKLYSEGLMNKDYFTENQAQFMAKGNGKECVEGFAMSWVPDNVMSAANAASFVAVAPMTGPSGNKPLWYKIPNSLGSIGSFAITKKCTNPAALVRYYDYVNSSLENVLLWDYGPEGTNWKKSGTNKWEVINTNYPKGSSFAAYRRSVGSMQIAYNCYFDEKYFVPDARNKLKLDAVNMLMPFVPKQQISGGFDTVDNQDQKNLLYTDINTYMNQFVADSIMRGIDDTKWQTHLSKLKALKAADYTACWQKYYNAHK